MDSHAIHGRRIMPRPLGGQSTLHEVVQAMTAYNGARLNEACRLFAEKLAKPDVVVCLTIAGAMTPGGYHLSCIIPLMEAGFIDWIVTTGANVYHDLHYALGYTVYQSGKASWDDLKLRENRMIRIYDVLFPEDALFQTDLFFQGMMREGREFQRTMGTAEFYHLCGKFIAERNHALKIETKTLLETAYRYDIPIFTSSPGDSSIGMNLAALQFRGETGLRIDSSIDVNDTAALVYAAKREGEKSAVVILGGGSPKNFALQTEPQIQQIFGLKEAGHDYFIQITDARPDTGGLSGATPSEAVTWGKIDPDQLPDTVVVYTDSAIALPIVTAYVLGETAPKSHAALYSRREEMQEEMWAAIEEARVAVEKIDAALPAPETALWPVSKAKPYYPSVMLPEKSFLAPPSDSVRESVRVVVIPFGLEKTTSYGKGTRKGPAAIIRASHDVEYLDEETGEESCRKGILTLEEPAALIDAMGHEEAIEYLYALVSGVASGEYPGIDALKKPAFPLVLGGEHSLTVGAVKALHDIHGPIHILHFDAHSDFRPAYEGSEFSHACAMTLCLPYAAQVVSVGIRSHAREAWEVVERHQEKIRIFWERHDIRRQGPTGIPLVAESIIELLQGKEVYLTFDGDVLDGATIGSSTGTPEPGGLSYNEVLDFWSRVLPHVDLIGADFTELSPIAGQHAPDFAIARLVYKLIGYVK